VQQRWRRVPGPHLLQDNLLGAGARLLVERAQRPDPLFVLPGRRLQLREQLPLGDRVRRIGGGWGPAGEAGQQGEGGQRGDPARQGHRSCSGAWPEGGECGPHGRPGCSVR
jgi:hypothetical protein